MSFVIHAEKSGPDDPGYARELYAMHLASPAPQLLPLANRPQDLHVVPSSQGHRTVASCWCGPTPMVSLTIGGGRIFVHHERAEEGN